MPRTLIVSLLMALAPLPVLAKDQAAADLCARTLSPNARLVYDSIGPRVKAQSDIRALLLEGVRPLVMAGRLAFADARPAAISAAACLIKLK